MSANLSVNGLVVASQPPPSQLAPPLRLEGAQHVEKIDVRLIANSLEKNQSKTSLQDREKNIQEALTHLNEEMQRSARSLQFSIDKQLNRTVIKVTNPHTGEVIRQIPDEAVLRVAHSIHAIKGILVNQLT